jgi:hypothetical protein
MTALTARFTDVGTAARCDRCPSTRADPVRRGRARAMPPTRPASNSRSTRRDLVPREARSGVAYEIITDEAPRVADGLPLVTFLGRSAPTTVLSLQKSNLEPAIVPPKPRGLATPRDQRGGMDLRTVEGNRTYGLGLQIAHHPMAG